MDGTRQYEYCLLLLEIPTPVRWLQSSYGALTCFFGLKSAFTFEHRLFSFRLMRTFNASLARHRQGKQKIGDPEGSSP